MPIDILMPALSPTMEKGNLAKWLKKEGDVIKSGDVLAEIETDKATMEVEAVDEGVLAKIVVPDGSADVPVNQVIGIITEEGEDASALPAAKANGAAPKSETPQADAMVLREERPGATPGATPNVTHGALETAKPQLNGHSDAGDRVIASPLARRIAKQAGVDLGEIAGSGPRGRIVERDVRAAEKAGPKPKAASAQAAPATQAPVKQPQVKQPEVKQPEVRQPDVKVASAPLVTDGMIEGMFTPGTYDVVPHDGMRRTIARRLTEARQAIPTYYLTLDCEIDALLSLREQINKGAGLNKEGKPRFKVSVNDFVIKALALALQRVPDTNATWTEGAMLKHKHSDVAVAVSIPAGLITPIIRQAELKTLSAISNEMRDLASRAKARKLKPEEYQGGVSAVSNLGMFGIKHFTAVINPPQSTILAVGAGEQRVVVKDGKPTVANLMTVTLSVDHRVADGALGAQLIEAFKTLIEAPMGMLV